jgi:hypothetical protein
MNLTESIYNKIQNFRNGDNWISVRRLRTLTLTNKNVPLKIWGETLEGDTYDGREVFTFQGPSRNPGVGYNYGRLGYMIFYDMNEGGYRTFVYDLITAIELNGVKYKVR